MNLYFPNSASCTRFPVSGDEVVSESCRNAVSCLLYGQCCLRRQLPGEAVLTVAREGSSDSWLSTPLIKPAESGTIPPLLPARVRKAAASRRRGFV